MSKQRQVGSVVNRKGSTGIVVANDVLFIGEKYYVWTNEDGRKVVKEYTFNDAVLTQNRSLLTKKVEPLYDGIIWINDQHNAKDVYTSEKAAKSLPIVNGKRVGTGDRVWIWRKSGQQWGLVAKQVTGVFYPHVGDAYLTASYADNNSYHRREPLNELYATRDEAIAAHPQRAKGLEIALLRAGKALGIENALQAFALAVKDAA